METVTDQQDVSGPKKGSPLMTDVDVEEIAEVEGVVDDIKGVYKIEPCEEQRIQYRKDVASHMTVVARPMNDVPSQQRLCVHPRCWRCHGRIMQASAMEKSCSLVEMRGISVHVGSHVALVHDELFRHDLVWAWAGRRQFHDGQEPSWEL
ncbi:hypothetical protein VPH35_104303 [Triticum aestivum]